MDRSELKGKLTFAGLDPIRPTVLKVGAAGAAVIAANAVVTALIHQEKTGEGQDIHVDLRKAFVNQSKWQDVLVDCVKVNGVSRMLGVKGYGESADLHLLPTRDNHFVQVSFPLSQPNDQNMPGPELRLYPGSTVGILHQAHGG